MSLRTIVFPSLVLLAPAGALAEDPAGENPFADIQSEQGPLNGRLEDMATLQVPEGFTFVSGRTESAKFMRATQNLVSGREHGVLLSPGQWWAVFEYDSIGYVEDADDEDLDADAMMESMKENSRSSNEERKRQGLPSLELVGWHTEPTYNPSTNNLEWGLALKGVDGDAVNYEVRLLGRHGVMSATLIAGPEQMAVALPQFRQALEGFAYTAGRDYGSYQKGDKIAEYGLAALVTGGALAVAAKTGLLARFWKLIVAGLVALGAGIKKLFGFGKRDEAA